MKTLIISPHTDDAIFSLGSFMFGLNNVTILTPFAKIPKDKVGKKKHTLLRREHTKACKFMNVKEINGDFLDDVYKNRDLKGLKEWFESIVKSFNRIIVPLGIHHPDHIIVRNIFINNFRIDVFYEELPYRVLYPKKTKRIRSRFLKDKTLSTFKHFYLKEKAVKIYKSQLISQELCPQLFVEERIWK